MPPGSYYICNRPQSLRNWRTDRAIGKFEWFALYRDDGKVDDQTFVEGLWRGQFRLHPGGEEGGVSAGCITLQHRTEFKRLREWLLGAREAYVSGSVLRTYGKIDVVSLAPDQLEAPHQRKKAG